MKAVSGLTLLFLLGAMFVSLFQMSTGMDMSSGMSDCPFTSHEDVLCPMNLADHIGVWKSVFLATASTMVLALVVAGAVAKIISIAPHLLAPRYKPILILSKQLRERVYTFSYRPFQELFSSGILHPKLF